MQGIFEEQLMRCGVEFFDYYWLHALAGTNYENVQKVGAFDFLVKKKEKKEEGRIRHIGFSFHDSPELLERILKDHPETEYVQLQLNYLDWDDAALRAKECYEIAARHGKPVIVMEPIKGGALANIPEKAGEILKAQTPGLSTASWAIRFAATHENVMMVLSGIRSGQRHGFCHGSAGAGKSRAAGRDERGGGADTAVHQRERPRGARPGRIPGEVQCAGGPV